MSMVSTVSQIPTDFSFPLRPDSFSSSNNRKSTSSTKTHSRQYTGIEIPLPISSSDISPPFTVEPVFPDTLTPPSFNSVSAIKASSPHKKHAHRRSAAISHDFQVSGQVLAPKPISVPQTSLSSGITLDLPLPLPKYQLNAHSSHGSLASSSPYSLQSPTLTFASSSSSSLPMQSSSSLSSAENITIYDSQAKPAKSPRVQFADSTEIKDLPAPQKHKKMRSWAGGLFSREKRNRSKQQQQQQQQPVLQDSPRTSEDSDYFHSSSYVNASEISNSSLLYLSLEPDVPLIDLDAALGPFQGKQSLCVPDNFHRRTESAPEAELRPRFERRKANSIAIDSENTIFEEDEDSTAAAMGLQQAASLSSTSLVSSSSNRDRARLARNVNSLPLGSLTPAPRDASTQAPTTTTPRIIDDPALAHIKALHRLSSTTNETITPSVSHRPNSALFDSPDTVRNAMEVESVCSFVSDEQNTQKPELVFTLQPPSIKSRDSRKSRFMRNPGASFSISSLASFATADSRKSTSSRVWSWMRGKRSGGA